MSETLAELSKRLEHYETPEWAVRAILEKEILTKSVIDPCTGVGILAEIAHQNGYQTWAYDIEEWGYAAQCAIQDFIEIEKINIEGDFTVFMNPPFSKACQFVEKSIDLGAQKIVCFQRFAWWESRARREFWKRNPPSRVYICGDRATCWRHDIPKDQRKNGTTTAHAWFVWEKGAPAGTLLGHIYKGDV